jgi:Tol biopolymer transport system component
MLPQEGSTLAIYEVNLKTRANRRLGGEAMARGMTLLPVLSPDGKTLAALHKELGSGNILDCQIVLIDVASGAPRTIGPKMDVAYLNWMPDGKGLVFLKRETSPDGSNAETICRMTMDGSISAIGPGRDPVVLPDGRVLFSANDRWKTCDLDGKNVQPFASGLRDYAFPSPAPDGKRIMMTQKSANGPLPTILPIGQSSGQPVFRTLPPGLWTLPAWQ